MSGSRSGMKALVESYRSETPRSKSPHMNNEEPINLAHFPAAKPPLNNEVPKIERDDFPAPPYPYSDPGEFYYYFPLTLIRRHQKLIIYYLGRHYFRSYW